MRPMCGCVKVQKSTVTLTKRFGKRDRTLQDGWHCVLWCLGYKVAGSLSLHLQKLNVRCNTRTKDDFFVIVVASISYCVEVDQAANVFYKLTNAKEVLQGYVFDAITAKTSVMLLDSVSVSDQKIELAAAVGEELGRAISIYGFKLIETTIVDIEPDAIVKGAIAEKQEAARLRNTTKDKAEAEKIKQVRRAEAEAKAAHLLGVGHARQHNDYVDALGDRMLALSEEVPGGIMFRLIL